MVLTIFMLLSELSWVEKMSLRSIKIFSGGGYGTILESLTTFLSNLQNSFKPDGFNYIFVDFRTFLGREIWFDFGVFFLVADYIF
jgi:hypothetical protein